MTCRVRIYGEDILELSMTYRIKLTVLLCKSQHRLTSLRVKESDFDDSPPFNRVM